MSDLFNLNELLLALPMSNNKLTALYEIKTALSSVHPTQLKDVVRNLSFGKVFEYLQTNESEQLEVCCSVLKQLLDAVDAIILLHNFHAELLHGLSHNSDSVVVLCLRQVLRATQVSVQQVTLYVDVVVKCVRTLQAESLSVTKEAAQIIVCLGQSADGLQLLFASNMVLPHLAEVMNTNEIIRYRGYEMVVDIAVQSEDALQCCAGSGLLPQLISDLQKDDILVRLNCVELLARLAVSEHGLRHLDQQGVITFMEDMLAAVEADPFGGLLLPGLLKFFGTVCHHQPRETADKMRPFFKHLFVALETGDVTLKGIAVETIGFIGQTPDGKRTLARQGEAMNVSCRILGRLLQDAPMDLRSKAFDAVRNLLHLEVHDQTDETLSLTEDWFSRLSSSNTMNTIMAVARQPFGELRVAALRAVTEMARLLWGQRTLNTYPGFNEYLLDRATETTKEGREEKYRVVRTLVDSPTTGDVFGRPYLLRLRQYDSEGPFYVQAEAAVAFDSAE